MRKSGDKLVLPVDCVISDKFDFEARTWVNSRGLGRPIPAEWEALDIGPKSVEVFNKIISGAKTIVWNGPIGVFEIRPSPRD